MSEEVTNNLNETAEEAEETVTETVEEVKEAEEAVAETVEEAVKTEEKKNKKEEPAMSKSKAKRENRKKEVKAAKKKKVIGKIIETVILAAIAIGIVVVIALGTYQNVTKVNLPDSVDFSECITDEGYIEDADLTSVKDIGLDSLVVPGDEVNPTDETIESEIQTLLDAHQEVSTDSSLTVADGDKINLDYVGTIDGEEFEGGSTDGAGTDLTIGSGSYVDDFEDQLIGTHPGDQLTVEVTFPDDYSTEDLAGKDASFAVTVNGIYADPEFNDEFIQNYYSDTASTAEEYKQYLIDSDYNENLETYLSDYIQDNASAKCPHAYYKHLESVIYYSEYMNFEYMNSYYSQYLGVSLYDDFTSYTGMTDSEYQANLKTEAKAEAAENMTYEAFFKAHNLTVTDDIYNEVLENYGDGAEDTYGKPYLMQIAMKLAVTEYLKANVTVQ